MFEKKHSIGQLFPTTMRSTDYGIPVNFPQRLLSNYSEFKSKVSQDEEQVQNTSFVLNQIQNQDAEALQNLLNLQGSNLVHTMSQRSSKKDLRPTQRIQEQQKIISPANGNKQQDLYESLMNVQIAQEHLQNSVQDTKNLLRNFGNAQNQFILYNQAAKEVVSKNMSDPQKFFNWVRKLKLQNFQQYKKVWGGEIGNKLFTRLYKQLCWKFYIEEAAAYVLMSRMKNQVTKMTHLKHIHRFLQGIKDPQNFRYFKKQ